jgi:hypothetical protein
LFGAQNATIRAPKLVITEELVATHKADIARRYYPVDHNA